MKLTIIREDGSIYQDGISYLDSNLSFIPTNVHALQWKDNNGWIEYSEDDEGNKQHNEKIYILPDWANTAIDICIISNTDILSANTLSN